MIRQRVSFAMAGAIVAGTALTVGLAGPASAATTPYDPSFVPGAGDLVGVGSDTIEIALDYLSKGHDGTPGFNSLGTPGFKIASWAAAGDPATVSLREGHPAIARSTINGSGSGKKMLWGTTNNPDVNFARSSSSLSTDEANSQLQQIPFAVDGLKLAVAASATNAPATITPAQMVGIYDGSITNWSQIGGRSGTIKPYVPPTTSGTYSFFIAQLKAANNNATVALGSNVGTAQEHDDALIKSDPNAIAPFSTARAKGLTSTITLEKGFKAYRAVYNVVRTADLGDSTLGPKLDAVFDEDGFVCSAAAKPLIEAAGFDQLARPSAGGVCGVPTQSAVSTFVTTSQVDTDTSLVAESLNGNKVRLTATVDAASDAEGSVQFTEDGKAIGSPVDVADGHAAKTLSLVGLGDHHYAAAFTPADPLAFTASASESVTVAVKTPSEVTVGLFNATGTYGSARLAAISATVDGEPATGKVSVAVDGGTAVDVTLSDGFAFYSVPGTTAVGSHRVTATLPGTSTVSADSASTTLTVTKATTTTSFALSPAKVKVGKATKAKVKVAITGASGVTPSGSVVIKSGARTVGTGIVTKGAATITIAKQAKKGTYPLKATFTGSSNYAGSSSSTVKLTVTK